MNISIAGVILCDAWFGARVGPRYFAGSLTDRVRMQVCNRLPTDQLGTPQKTEVMPMISSGVLMAVLCTQDNLLLFWAAASPGLKCPTFLVFAGAHCSGCPVLTPVFDYYMVSFYRPLGTGSQYLLSLERVYLPLIVRHHAHTHIDTFPLCPSRSLILSIHDNRPHTIHSER